LSQGKAPQGVAGPVGIVQITGLVAKEGILPLLELLAVLSINLAVFNVLPIPAMDGGRLFFIYIEAIFRKRVSSETEQKVNNWGMAFLIGLMVLISFQDVLRLLWPNKFFGQ
jgi:regulator of sigma E protease